VFSFSTSLVSVSAASYNSRSGVYSNDKPTNTGGGAAVCFIKQ
jgi:hypothetical protein